MFHVLGFQANAAASTETTLTPIADNVLQNQNNGFFSNSMLQLIGSVLFGADCQYGKVVMPSLNCFGYDYLNQIIPVTAGNTQNADLLLRHDSPLKLPAREQIKISGLQNNAGAQDITALALVTKGLQAKPAGDVITIRGTSTTAATADTWSELATTWDVDLPVGNYAVVGGRVEGANGYAWRINAQDCELRPGYVMMGDVALLDNPLVRFGRLGRWCNFDNNLMPLIEVLCSAATASFVIYLDIVKLS